MNELPEVDFSAETPVDELVKSYVETRNFLATKRQEWEDLERAMKDIMARISMALRDKGDHLGVDSFKTAYGTAYRSVKTSYRVANWDQVLEYIRRTGNYQILEKRVGKLATKEIHDATGEVPPGIDFAAEVEFLVRKS